MNCSHIYQGIVVVQANNRINKINTAEHDGINRISIQVCIKAIYACCNHSSGRKIWLDY